MPAFLESIFQNIAPFVLQISLALVVVFVISFAAGWLFARLPDHPDRHEER